MKYIIVADAWPKKGDENNSTCLEIPVEVETDGDIDNTSVILTLEGREYIIHFSELSHLMYIINDLVE